MAAPTYTTDLVVISTCEALGTFVETGTYTTGVAPALEPDFFIQGSNCVAKYWTTGGGGGTPGGSIFDYGSNITFAAGACLFIWINQQCPNNVDTEAAGGIRIIMGDLSTAFKVWKGFGKDTYTYGGWKCCVVDPTTATDFANVGSPTGAWRWFGAAALWLALAKGGMGIDVMRYGRGQARITGGAAANYATFPGYAAVNDGNTARWGLIQAIDGGYLQQGLVNLGFSTVTTTNRARDASNVATLTTSGAHGFVVGDTVIITGVGGTGYNATAVITVVGSTTTFSYANTGSSEGTTADTGGSINGVVDFRDSNTSIVIANTKKVAATFNLFNIRNASSRVDWTSISFQALGTVSRGDFTVTDNATVNWIGCTFTDVGLFSVLSNTIVTNCIFRRTDKITTGGATLTNCQIDNNRNAVNVLAATTAQAALISGCTFTSDGTGHGLEINGSPANMTLTNDTWIGYAAGDGTTGNEAVYVNTSPGSMTLAISGGTIPSVRAAAGVTVTVSASVAVTFAKMKDNSEVRIYLAGTSTVVDGIENVTAGSTDNRSFTWSAATGTSVDYVIHNFLSGVPIYKSIRVNAYAVPASATTIDIQQILDCNVT